MRQGLGGKKMCSGPRGDPIDTIRRRSITVAAAGKGGKYMYVLKASATDARWEQVGPLLGQMAGSFDIAGVAPLS